MTLVERYGTFLLVAACIAVPALRPAELWAQTTTSVRGTVTDPSGARFPNVTIALKDQNTGTITTTTSDGIGNFAIPQLRLGTYDLTALASKFNRFELHNLNLEAGTLSIDIRMTFSLKTEINVKDATVEGVLSRDQIGFLPVNDRNPLNLVALQPGIVSTDIEDRGVPDTRGGSVAGARSDQISIAMDGVNVNDQQTGKAFESVLPVNQDSIQEIRVVTVNATSHQGRSSGGQVSLVTRRGENAFHGAAYGYQRNAVTSANNFFNNSTINPVTGKTLERPKFNRNIFGGSLGGPIRTNKLFFFFNFEDSITRREEPEIRRVPSDTLRLGILRYFDINGVVRSVTAQELQAMDPNGIGPNAAVLALMRRYPVGNDPNQGDGLNFTGFRFNAPLKSDKPSYIGRIDYKLSEKQSVFVRGSMANYKVDDLSPQFPGQPAALLRLDDSKGVAVGHTFTISPNLLSVLHWGVTRQALQYTGGNTDPGLTLGGMDDIQNYGARNNSRTIPTYNLLEDLTWIKQRHTLQFGVNFRNIHNKRFTEEKTYPSYSSNSSTMINGGRDLLPVSIDENFTSTYADAQMALLGTINQVDITYYVNRDGSVFPSPHVPRREFINNEFEWYAQDQWKIWPSLTLTAGLRYSYFAPPYEKSGFQVRADFDINNWFATRRDGASSGIPSNANPLLSFVLAGKANHASPTFDPDRNNFAPRIALAWSPSFTGGPLHAIFGSPDQSWIRFGAAVLYDRTGGMFPITTDLDGAIGLATHIRTPTPSSNYDTAPRFNGLQDLSSISVPSAPAAGFPSTPDFRGNTGFMVDTALRTPYSTILSFLVSRSLPAGFSVEGAYAGRIGRKLLLQNDFAAPLVNFRDPKSGQSWVEAAGIIAGLKDRNTPLEEVPAIPFFENIFAPIASSEASASQFVYNALANGSWMDVLHALDVDSPSSILGPYTFFQQQFDWLPAWTNLGQSSYHSFQLIVHKRLVQGFQADFNYTLAKSMDNGSSVESEGGQGRGQILNAFAPRQSLGYSDFDVRHQVNSTFVLQLPFGRGRQFGPNLSPLLNGIVGGWTLSGLVRWRTGFPFSDSGNDSYPTNYFVTGSPTLKADMPVPATKVTKKASGGPNIFADPEKAYNAFEHTLSGFSGSRNIMHGPGFFNFDAGIQRTFKLSGDQTIQFRWETYNLTNSVNFDGRPNAGISGAGGIGFSLSARSSFGQLRSTAGSPRIMQFALRYEF